MAYEHSKVQNSLFKDKDFTLPVRLLSIFSIIIFFIAYYQSRNITFRVEHWDILYFYSRYEFNPLNLRDWIKIAFWTPLGDFRFVPLAYICNFIVFRLLGINNFNYLMLSIFLTIVNGFLLAKFVSKLKGDNRIDSGLIAGSLFLLFPAKLEITIWTFFIYKLVHTALILLSLISFEEFLLCQRRRFATLSIILLFVSALFYEASLPIAMVFLIRIFLFKSRVKKNDKIYTLGLVLILYLLYAAIFKFTVYYMIKYAGMYTPYPMIGGSGINYSVLLPDLMRAFRWWTGHGIIMANSGFRLNFIDTGYQFNFEILKDNITIPILLLLWGFILINIRPKPFPWKNALYMLLIFFFGSIIVLAGRTLTNGPNYLPIISMYQYFPTMSLAAILGYLMDDGLRKSRHVYKKLGLFISVFLLFNILGYANYNSVRSYMRLNSPVFKLIKDVGERIKENPDARIYVGNINLPCAPVYTISSEEHTYHAMALLYGDNIVLEKK